MGMIKAKIVQKNTDEIDGSILNVKYVPKLWCILFIISSAIDQG